VAVKVAEVQNMARHVLRNALVLWLSGRGDEGNRQAETTKPTKCRDSLQVRNRFGPGYPSRHNPVVAGPHRSRPGEGEASRGLARRGHPH
jgi:hypothetical protein